MSEIEKQGEIKLVKPETTKEALQKLVNDYKNLVVTKETIKQCDEARLVLYRERIKLQNQDKKNNDLLNDLKKKNSKLFEELIAITQPTEDRLKKEIADIEAAEKKRVADLHHRIKNIELSIVRVAQQTDIDLLKKSIDQLSAMKNTFSELNELGNKTVEDAITSVKARIITLEAQKVIEDKEKNANVSTSKEGAKHGVMPVSVGYIAETKTAEEYPLTPQECFRAPESEEKVEYTTKATDMNLHVSKVDFYSYAGYEIAIDKRVPKQDVDQIRSLFISIVDNLPM